jgi:SpoVK/Ycf46/Vps4 family AAA+-type ATPase
MIGMNELKNNIVDQILYFVQELHKNKNTSGDFMHTVIYGPPGTGKTEIAKMMGKIYSKLGILTNGTFKKVTRSDLIAGYLGQTAIKTRDVIKEALGGVLFIDEAYSLGNPEKKDSFSKECIDTLCEALSDNKDNLMVIIAGYETELKECFFNYNQGLDSRFTWRFKTDNYTAEDLYKIFIKKVQDIGWEIHADSKITPDFFKKNYDYLKFFGRDIETILAKTKIAHSKRVFCKPESEKKKITIKDLEKGFEMFLKNDDIKNRKDVEFMRKQLYNTLYS